MKPGFWSPFISRRRTRGFSLVELLVAMTLGLILISGMIGVFSGNKRSAQVSGAMADLQENARFALNVLAEDIRMSGHQGCLDLNNGSINTRARWWPTNDLRRSATTGAWVVASDNWLPSMPRGYMVHPDNPAVPGTQVLNLQFGGPVIARLAGQMANGTPSSIAAIQTATPLSLDDGDWAIIANCDIGDLFRVTGVNAARTSFEHADTGNLSDSLTLAYGDARTIDQTALMRFHSNVYFVGETGFQNKQGQSMSALYQRSLPYHVNGQNPASQIVSGVENMRVAFGLRQTDGTLRYVTPVDAAYDPALVEAVQIGLLMVSEEAILDSEDTRTYRLAEQPIHASKSTTDLNAHPQDKRFRVAFNTTVKVRNRRNDRL